MKQISFGNFFLEITGLIKVQLKHCDRCLFYELVYVGGDLGEYHDHCNLGNWEEMNKKFTCDEWVHHEDRTYLIRILCEIKSALRHKKQRKWIDKAIARYKRNREYPTSRYTYINELINALKIKWSSGISVEQYKRFLKNCV